MKNTVIQNNYEEVNNVKNNVALEQSTIFFKRLSIWITTPILQKMLLRPFRPN